MLITWLAQRANPAAIVGATPSVGGYSTCALAGTSIYCWGVNYNGEVGVPFTTGIEAIPRIHTGSWRALSTGSSHTCAIAADLTLWCWGLNGRGQLGRQHAHLRDPDRPESVVLLARALAHRRAGAADGGE